VVEDLISSGVEDHGPTNVREHFPEKELTPGKNRLLFLCSKNYSADWNKVVIKMLWKQFVVIRVQPFSLSNLPTGKV